MPDRPWKACAGSCGKVIPPGRTRCASCATASEQRRGSAASRGYDHHWQAFRRRYISRLIEQGIVPVCGAHLPDGPLTGDSQCHAQGLLTGENRDGTSLHLDHEPPLLEHERTDPRAVCDANRIQLLCDVCHQVKTRHMDRGAA